jgi:glycosyltransferase involved in cell wall biosynthesis
MYLKECVDSVLMQTYQHYEVLLINDGSTDASPRICDEYTKQDSRIKVIHQKNGGASVARNTGINNASNDYIIFLDSDDYWDDPAALMGINMIAEKTNADVIVWGHKKKQDHSGKIDAPSVFPTIDFELSQFDVLKQLISTGFYKEAAWDKAVKRSLFLRHKLYFEQNVFSEDMEWTARVALYSNSFVLYPNAFYIYRRRAGSITTSSEITERKIEDVKKHFISCYTLANNADKRIRPALQGYAAMLYANLLILVGQSKKTSIHVKEIKQYASILNASITGRSVLINRIKKILGLRLTAWLLALEVYRRKLSGRS